MSVWYNSEAFHAMPVSLSSKYSAGCVLGFVLFVIRSADVPKFMEDAIRSLWMESVCTRTLLTCRYRVIMIRSATVHTAQGAHLTASPVLRHGWPATGLDILDPGSVIYGLEHLTVCSGVARFLYICLTPVSSCPKFVLHDLGS